MHACSKRILSEIIKTEKRSKGNTSHPAHQSALLRIKSVREYPLMTCKVQSLIFIRVICLLKNSNVVSTTFAKISILIAVHRIDLDTYVLKVLLCNLTSLAYVLNIRHLTTLTRQNENLFKPCVCNCLHFLMDFFHGKLCSFDFVMAVKSAVNTVVLTVVRYVYRREEICGISEMLSCF